MIVPLEHILVLAAVLFFLGMGGLLAWRANLIMMLVCIEVMLNEFPVRLDTVPIIC